MCAVQIFRLTVCDPETMSRLTIHAIHSDHLPVDQFPECHLAMEAVTVDEDGPGFEDALNVSFSHLIAPLRVRA